MKISKLINMIIVLFLLVAFLPPREASAAWVIIDNQTLSTPTTAVRDWVITSGGVLTISPGVTVTVNCTDIEPYASGTDPNKIEIIVEDGTLIADGVIFVGATPGTACWHGIRILGDGDAEIENSTIEDARIGITVEGSSPTISGNTIRNIRGADQAPTSFPQAAYGIYVYQGQSGLAITDNTITNVRAGSGCDNCSSPDGRIAYGISISDSTGIQVEGNTINMIYGGNGGSGFTGTSGDDGSAGSSAGSASGGPGVAGTDGGNGGNGGAAYGIFLHSTTTDKVVNVHNNIVSGIEGGDADPGGLGGRGGNGGLGFTQKEPYGDFAADGGFGGNGGKGGNGGSGGSGGDAYGLFGFNIQTAITDNQVNNLRPGLPAMGGQGGVAGNAGNGGGGSPVQTTPSQIPAGYGGGGGIGGAGGLGGNGGNAGSGYGVAMEFGALLAFNGNTVTYIFAEPGASGAAGKTGGSGGLGGNGGSGTVGYEKGAGGGEGGPAGASGAGGNSGNGGSAYGLYMNNTAISNISQNSITRIMAGAGAQGSVGASASNLGGKGGNVGAYPDTATASVKGGKGGAGSNGGKGGNGGSAGLAYGIYANGTLGNLSLTNNLLANIVTLSGGIGGAGGNGSNGGVGGSGDVSQGTDRPGGNGGNGGAAGNGGDGGWNAGGNFNTYGLYTQRTGSTNTIWTVTNNTIATVQAANVEPAGGARGNFGVGGAGGAGTPPGDPALNGAAGSNGQVGWKGGSTGYYSGEKITSTLMNNIVVSFETPTPNNSIGMQKATSGTFTEFKYGDAWGWHRNYGSNLTGIDITGSISADPLMLDPGNYKYRLQATSPCKDTAINKGAPGVDRDDVPRPLGSGMDMGAFEQGSYYRFSQASMSVNEGAGTATIIIELVGYLETAGTVSYTFVNGTAVNGTDFNHGNSQVSFSSGSIGGTREITPVIYDDTDIEGNETFQVNLHSPTGGALMSPSSITVTIIDNDMFPIFLPLIIR